MVNPCYFGYKIIEFELRHNIELLLNTMPLQKSYEEWDKLNLENLDDEGKTFAAHRKDGVINIKKNLIIQFESKKKDIKKAKLALLRLKRSTASQSSEIEVQVKKNLIQNLEKDQHYISTVVDIFQKTNLTVSEIEQAVAEVASTKHLFKDFEQDLIVEFYLRKSQLLKDQNQILDSLRCFRNILTIDSDHLFTWIEMTRLFSSLGLKLVSEANLEQVERCKGTQSEFSDLNNLSYSLATEVQNLCFDEFNVNNLKPKELVELGDFLTGELFFGTARKIYHIIIDSKLEIQNYLVIQASLGSIFCLLQSCEFDDYKIAFQEIKITESIIFSKIELEAFKAFCLFLKADTLFKLFQFTESSNSLVDYEKEFSESSFINYFFIEQAKFTSKSPSTLLKEKSQILSQQILFQRETTGDLAL
eukprot:snap_masked-scaffold_10-processed-gene-10.10-mRNA-1 protein AED:1.00 eAED:1.00 QI:0/-1/0/0/-1/1/1/0/417